MDWIGQRYDEERSNSLATFTGRPETMKNSNVIAAMRRAIAKEMMDVLSAEARRLRALGEEDEVAEKAGKGLYTYFMLADDESLSRLYSSIENARINVSLNIAR